jgi:hypothetical protein
LAVRIALTCRTPTWGLQRESERQPRGRDKFRPHDCNRNPEAFNVLAADLVCFTLSDHMRLINAKTLELKRFDDDTKIPRYAILSHTWGNKEVSLQQFQDACTGDSPTNVAVRKTSGYAKIVQTCRLALEDGCSYAWVDTCERRS